MALMLLGLLLLFVFKTRINSLHLLSMSSSYADYIRQLKVFSAITRAILLKLCCAVDSQLFI